MGTTTVDDETILSQPILPATRCGIVGSGTREDEEDEEDEDNEEEEIERDKPGEGGDEHGDDDEEDADEEDEEDEGGADNSRSCVPSGDSSRAVPGALGEP
jgi:hypothetical protein